MEFRHVASLVATLLSLFAVGVPLEVRAQGDPSAGFGMLPLDRGAIPLGPLGARLLKEALVFEERGEILKAIDKHKEIVAAFPNAVYSINSLAGLYGTLGETAEQIDWASLAVMTDPTFSLGYINLGNGRLASGEADRAVDAYAVAVELDPSEPIAYYGLGQVAEARGKSQESAFWYKKSVEVDPGFSNGWFNLGVTQANMGEFVPAIQSMMKVLQIEPDAGDAKALLEDFRRAAR